MGFFTTVMADFEKMYIHIMSLFTSFTFALTCWFVAAVIFCVAVWAQEYERYIDSIAHRVLSFMFSVLLWFGLLGFIGSCMRVLLNA